LKQYLSGFSCTTLDPEAPHSVHRLRSQSDVPHDRDARLNNGAYRRRNIFSALELHRLSSCLLQQSTRRPESLLSRDLVRQKMKVTDHMRSPRTPTHSATVIDHFIECHRQSIGVPLNNHSQ